jgi:WD40 repeat protein
LYGVAEIALVRHQAVRRPRVAQASGVLTAAFNPLGTEVVAASKDGTARIWDVASGKPLMTLNGHAGPVFSAAFSPDGRKLVTASEDGEIRILDGESGKQLTVLSGHEGVVFSAAFNTDGSKIVAGNQDGTAAIWSTQLSGTVQSLERIAEARVTGQLSPQERKTYLPR